MPIYNETISDPNLIETLYKQWISLAVIQEAKKVSELKLYYEGLQPSRLNEDQKTYLGTDRLMDNYCKQVVDLPSSRTNVDSWINSDEIIMALANTISNANQNAGSSQSDIYKNANRDGSAFVLVEYSDSPLFSFQADGGINSTNVRWSIIDKAYTADATNTSFAFETDIEAESIYGARLHKTQSGVIDFGSIRWQSEDIHLVNSKASREFLSLYYPDRIEHYTKRTGVTRKFQNAGWIPFFGINNDMDWPTPWVDAQGNPLGVPIFEFSTPGGTRLTESVLSMQDTLNDTVADIAGGARYSGFPLTYTIGEDTTKEITLNPARLLKIPHHDSKVGRLAGSDLKPLLDVASYFHQSIGRQADIPPYLLKAWGVVPPSGISLKAQENSLITFVDKVKVEFTLPWYQIMAMSLNLERVFGRNLDIPVGSSATPIWNKSYTPTVDEMETEAEARRKSGVPNEVILVQVWGYTPEQAKKFISIDSEDVTNDEDAEGQNNTNAISDDGE